MRPKIAIVGAGLAGLTAAYELRERAERLPGGVELICFEADSRPGGAITATAKNGFLFERGPSRLDPERAATATLLRRLGLQDQVVPASEGSRRMYVFRNGRLRRLPESRLAWMRSDLLPTGSKFRALLERLTPRPADGVDESLLDLAERRFGARAGGFLADALATTLCCGEPDRLSVAAAAPWLAAADRRGSGLIAELLSLRDRQEPPTPWSQGAEHTLQRGLAALTRALAAELEAELRLNEPVESIADMGQRGFRLILREGAPLDVDAVVLACPASATARLVESMDVALAHGIRATPAHPVATVHLGFRAPALGNRTRGAGFVVPRGQGLRILGSRWISNRYPGRAPADNALIQVQLGGARDRVAVDRADDRLIAQAREDLRLAMGIVSAPWTSHVDRQLAVPQFTVGHLRRVEEIKDRTASHAGLWLTAGWLGDGSVDGLIEQAAELAEGALTYVDTRAIAAAR